MMDDTPASATCALCNNTPTIPCPACSAVLYCSPECQAADEPTHALLCAAFASPPPRPPEGRHVLGLLFPARAAAPALAWVRLGGFADESTGISFQEVDVDALFGADDGGGGDGDGDGGDSATARGQGPEPVALHSERNRVRSRDTRSMLEIWHYPPGAAAKASVPPEENRCIKALAEGGEGPFFDWRGLVVVVAMTRSTGFMVDPGAYRNCELGDFRDAVDFVLDHGNDAHDRKIREALEMLGAQAVEEVESDGGHEGGDHAPPKDDDKPIVLEMAG